MKRILALFFTAVLLTGCMGASDELNRALSLREKLLNGDGCTFEAEISADYGEKVHTFSMQCQGDGYGNLSFTVTNPQSISGITGCITQEGGKLTFDDQALAFELLADGQITPVSSPWLLLQTLRSGYIRACGNDGDLVRLEIDDSYEEDALHLDIWLNSDDLPIRGEILWQGRRVVSLDVRNFTVL